MEINDVVEDDITSCITYREQLIERGHKLVVLSNGKKANMQGVTARELVNLASQLREHGIRCVQKIVAWTLANTDPDEAYPKTFMWNGLEYLCKMHSDLDFMAESLPPNMTQHGGFAVGDPFFLTRVGGQNSHRRAGVAAALIVLDALERRRVMFGIDYSEEESECSSVEEAEDSRRKSMVIVHHRRRGVTDLYNSRENAEREKADARLRPAVVRTEVEENVVFRGRKLYRRGPALGKGASATVYACDRQDGERYAVKVYKVSANPTGCVDDEETYARICYQREVEIMRSLAHPHIITLEDSLVREGVPYMVMERMSCTLLEVQMDRTAPADKYKTSVSKIERYAMVVLEQLSGALAYMHSLNVMHRDIKPENVLVTMYAKGIIAKLGDLGSAVQLPGKFGELNVDLTGGSDLTHYVGSRWYRAPEMLGNGHDYGPAADIWSLGCTLSEFVTMTPLFEGNDEQEVFNSIISLFPDNQIPQSMQAYMLDRGLEMVKGITKRSIHHELGCVSSALRKIVECMVCIVADERYSAAGIYRDVKELRVET